MTDNITKQKMLVVMVISFLLIALISLAGVAYALLLRPQYGLRYADIFFMVSFILIFASLMYVYHIWVLRIQKKEDEGQKNEQGNGPPEDDGGPSARK